VQLSLLSGAIAIRGAGVVFVRHRRARRYILRVLPDGTLRVTLPRWGARREAERFIAASQAWIDGERMRLADAPPRATPWGEGSTILLDGRLARVRVEPDAGGLRVWLGGVLVAAGARHTGGVRTLVRAWLRRRAAAELPARLLALAAAYGVSVRRVSVRDQRSRWGACSPAGTITLNWRLIQTPAFVRDYVLLHEIMHRRELNHSRRFWTLVAACCPGHREARQWLRTEGKALWSDGES
jgi:hypothetical protein